MSDDTAADPTDATTSDQEKFVLGGGPVSKGIPVGGTVDVDGDPDSEAGERVRVVKPYRWWTLAFAVVGLAGIAWGAYAAYSGGLADFGSNDTVSTAKPTSATSYSDGTVEVRMDTVPVKSCDAGESRCAPNQFIVEWRKDGSLAVGAFRTAPDAAERDDVPACLEGDVQISADGLLVLRNPSGQAPRAVVDAFTLAPVSVTSGGTRSSGQAPGFAEISAPPACRVVASE